MEYDKVTPTLVFIIFISMNHLYMGNFLSLAWFQLLFMNDSKNKNYLHQKLPLLNVINIMKLTPILSELWFFTQIAEKHYCY